MIRLAYSRHCIEDDCDAHGTGERSNAQAERHTKDYGHATSTYAVPEGKK